MGCLVIDVVVLNRNLGSVCDALCAEIDSRFGSESKLVVVDCSTSPALSSTRKTVVDESEMAIQSGLRFNRGMNKGIAHLLDEGSDNPWILLLPVDTEIVHLDLEALLTDLSEAPQAVAVKPLSERSVYSELLGQLSFGLGWNFEEGPWLLRSEFVKQQVAMSHDGAFFDPSNFRGFLTGLEIGFRAYSNGKAVGISRNLVLRENETYLIEKSELMRTERVDEHMALYVSEGEAWLSSKYGIEDPWDFAQVVRLLFEQFMVENPQCKRLAIGRSYK